MTKLNTPAALRLELYKQRAEKLTEAYKKNYNSEVVHHWKDQRYNKPKHLRRYEPNRYREDGALFIEDINDTMAQYIGDSSELASLRHTGWYCDDTQEDLLKGCVFRIRTPDGMRYIPATRLESPHFDNGGATLYLKDLNDDERDAARYADQLAESQAEKAREDSEKYYAEQKIEECREEIHRINKEALPLIFEIKTNNKVFSDLVNETLKEKLGDLLEERAKMFEAIDVLPREPWRANEFL